MREFARQKQELEQKTGVSASLPPGSAMPVNNPQKVNQDNVQLQDMED